MSKAQKQGAACQWWCGDAEGGEPVQEDAGAQPGEEVPEFDADWGLETLVNVGEHWIDSLLQVLQYLDSLRELEASQQHAWKHTK